MTNTTPKLVNPVETSGVDPDPFDPEYLRLDQSFLVGAGVKRVLNTIPTRKPNPQDFIRVNADEKYRMPTAVIELKDDREFYLLPPPVAKQLPGEYVTVMLYLAINRQGVLFLWPVKLPGIDGKVLEWHRSAADAAEHAMKHWVRVKANTSLGAYEYFEATAKIPDQEWPQLTYQELLRIAFKDRYVDSVDHLVVRKLRGG